MFKWLKRKARDPNATQAYPSEHAAVAAEDDEDDEDDDFDYSVRSATDIVYRSLALEAVCRRASIESMLIGNPGEKLRLEQAHKELLVWIASEGIAEHLSGRERRANYGPLGTLHPDEVFELGWKLQALVTMLWSACRLDPLPGYERSTGAASIQDQLMYSEPTAQLLAAASRREDEVLARETECARFWHWRATHERLRREGFNAPVGDTFEASVARAIDAALADGMDVGTIGDDVMCQGIAYHQLSDEQFADVWSTALERHKAINWVCGYGKDWDRVRADT